MELINTILLDEVSKKAQHDPRLRINYNLHTSLEAKSQRLLNAMQPGTVLPVHRHRNTAETFILLKGSIRVLFYNDNGEREDTIVLNPLNGLYGINIPLGQWHTVEVLEPNTVIFETKDGPYTPLNDEDVMKISKSR
jgi:WxcM-like, C-terminal.